MSQNKEGLKPHCWVDRYASTHSHHYLLTSMLFNFNITIHFTPIMCYTWQAVSGHLIQLITLQLY